MRFASLSRLLIFFGALFLVFTPVGANVTKEEAARLLPDKIRDFQSIRKAESALSDDVVEQNYEKEFTVTRAYRSTRGDHFEVTLVKTRSDRGAYSLYSTEVQKLAPGPIRVDGVGTVATTDSTGRLLCYKGLMLLDVSDTSQTKDPKRLVEFARALADPIDKGEGEIPVLLKHLPDWEANQQRAVYAVSLQALQEAAGHRPVLDVVNFSGGAEAVTALYGDSRLVIVEHTTPQLATESNTRINARIGELKASGQPVPTAYRRVGNYVVFVFDAPDETTAVQLIEKIGYEQVVQWLGDNPNWLLRAEREYRRTTAGVILAVFKASGISILLSLLIGGIFGSIIFRRRRRQQANARAYSDAGGMLRLNIDELTPDVDPSRLLGKGDG